MPAKSSILTGFLLVALTSGLPQNGGGVFPRSVPPSESTTTSSTLNVWTTPHIPTSVSTSYIPFASWRPSISGTPFPILGSESERKTCKRNPPQKRLEKRDVDGRDVADLVEQGIVSPPVSVSVTPSFVANVPENTHTYTVGQNGETTPVPIVGGPECWFCPKENENNHAEGGWALLGLDGPGTYQPFSDSESTGPFPVIFVSSNGNPVYAPSQTTDELSTKVKRRGPLPTYTHVVKEPRYKVFERYVPTSLGHYNGEGFAIKQKSTRRIYRGIEIPTHYVLIAGFLRHTVELVEVYDECGDAPKAIQKIMTYDWDSRVYDLNFNDDTQEVFMTQRGDGRDWVYRQDNYKWLGRIKPHADHEYIVFKADQIFYKWNESGGYQLFLRDCRKFAKKLYEKIKA